jgi:hypothetical protein
MSGKNLVQAGLLFVIEREKDLELKSGFLSELQMTA